MRARLIVAVGGMVAAATLGCGSMARHPGSPSSGGPPPPPPPTLVTPPPAAAVVELTMGDLLDLAQQHRVKTATIYDDAVTGTMVSDASDGQQFAAPRDRGSSVTSLTRALSAGGAAIAIRHGPKPT